MGQISNLPIIGRLETCPAKKAACIMSRSNIRYSRRFAIALVLALLAGLEAVLAIPRASAQEMPPAVEVTLGQCIQIGLNNQAAIQVQMAAAGAAEQQEAIAQSYFYPQIDLQSRFTNASSVYSVAIPSPVTGQLADVVADSGAFFGIAKQAGSAAAQAALDNPNASVAPGLPSFNAARQAVLNALPVNYDVDLLGQNFLTTQITLVQPLWAGGKIRYRREQAELGTRAAQYDVERTRQETTYNITRAYLAILLSGELIGVAEETAERFEWIEKRARGEVDRGNVNVSNADLFRASALRCLAESEKAGMARVRDRARAGLLLAMGLDQQAQIQIADRRLMCGDRDLDASSLLQQAIARRPDLAKAEIGERAAQLERQIARAAYSPEVAAIASFSNVWDDGHFANPTHPNEGTVGVGMQMPLFEGGRRSAESRRAECEQAQACQVRRLLSDLVSQEVQDAYFEYLQSKEQLKLDREAVSQGRKAMETLEKMAGLVESKDMPKYFQDLVLTQQMLTQVLVRCDQTVYNCNLAMGRIRLVTACDEYQTFMENGETDARRISDAVGSATTDDGGR